MDPPDLFGRAVTAYLENVLRATGAHATCGQDTLAMVRLLDTLRGELRSDRQTPQDGTSTPRRVELVNQRGDPWIVVWAEIDDGGDLLMSGQDLGKSVEETWGDSDLEYWLRVPAANRDDALRAILELADSFPQRPLDVSVLDRFSSRQVDVERDLYPMLPATERPSVEELVSQVASLLESLSRLAPEHREYLRLLAEENDYRPDLLFGDSSEALEPARVSPRMEWKLQNLRSRAM